MDSGNVEYLLGDLWQLTYQRGPDHAGGFRNGNVGPHPVLP